MGVLVNRKSYQKKTLKRFLIYKVAKIVTTFRVFEGICQSFCHRYFSIWIILYELCSCPPKKNECALVMTFGASCMSDVKKQGAK